MKKIFALSIIIIALQANAQQYNWGVSFTPALITTNSTNEIHFGLQAGVEYKINDRLSLLTEFAIKADNKIDSAALQTKYFRIKPELRYAFRNHKKNTLPYVGVQMSYAFRKWNDMTSGSYSEKKKYSDSSITYSSATIKTPVFTTSLQLGSIIKMGKHFCADFFFGVGVRVIDTEYSNLKNVGKKQRNRATSLVLTSPDPAYFVNGTVVRFHFNSGIRLLYRF